MRIMLLRNAIDYMNISMNVCPWGKSEQAMDSLESDKPGKGVGIEGISVGDSDAGEI